MPAFEKSLGNVCVICGGEITKKGSDICCFDEDQFLLSELKAYIRRDIERKADLGELLEHLYEQLGPFLSERGIDLDEIDPDEVFIEIEKRILRWIARKEVTVSAIDGLAICEKCNAMIMRGRTLCNQCLREKEMSQLPPASIQSNPPPRGGMHIKR